MALILRGKTRCALCKEVLEKKQEIRAFPPFVANRLDPLYVLNDAAVHKACFHNFELGERAVEILHRVRLLFENRSCIICEQIGYYTDADHSLHGKPISKSTRSRSLFRTADAELLPAQRTSFQIDLDSGSG